ncbi:MAG: chloride channel protein [Synergistales bacterium]|jgi:H+/Cl- antiporter ClcA
MMDDRNIRELAVLSYSLAKWLSLSVLAGAVVGTATSFFLLALEWSIDFVNGLPPWRFALLPLGFLASAALVRFLAPDASGHGTEKVIEAIHQRQGRIAFKVVPVKLAATIITLATGGSAGKEGPCAQIGAGLMSVGASLFRFGELDRKKLVICGISAGFAAVFGTPVAGALFGVEVLYVGQMLTDVLLPSLVSGVTAHLVSMHWGVVHGTQPLFLIPDTSGNVLAWAVAAGVFFGLVSLLHIEILKLGERFFGKWPVHPLVKPVAGGLLILAVTAVAGSRYLGLGTDTIDAALAGDPVPKAAWLVKSLLTSVTLSCGGSGGIVTPTFFVGAASGSLFATVFGLDRALFSGIGLVAVLAAAANTPIAAMIMGIELFGAKAAPLGAVSCIVAFLISGHRSVYPSQILSRSKSKALILEEPTRIDSSRSTPRFSGLLIAKTWRFLRPRLRAAIRKIDRAVRPDRRDPKP